VLQKSPNPDPSLPWPSDMELSHLGEYAEAHIQKLRLLKKHKLYVKTTK
jgi:hypothetical protein